MILHKIDLFGFVRNFEYPKISHEKIFALWKQGETYTISLWKRKSEKVNNIIIHKEKMWSQDQERILKWAVRVCLTEKNKREEICELYR